jgi:hypothetical protein
MFMEFIIHFLKYEFRLNDKLKAQVISHKTRRFSAAKINYLMLCRKIIFACTNKQIVR